MSLLQLKVIRMLRENLHAVVLLVHSLQVLLELLQLNEAVVCQLCVLLHLTVHFFKLESREEEKHQQV